MIDRRTLLGAAGAAVAAQAVPAAAVTSAFPQGFLWGAAGAAHQTEGNNTNSDSWVLETVKPTVYAEVSGDADNSFALWPADLDLVKAMGLNTYRFSLEWARIEPEPGLWSISMLDHYKQIVEGCQARGIVPMVTFNHFTTPRWFAADGGWTSPRSPDRFARFCDRAARHLSTGIGYATTLNEPNGMRILRTILPPPVFVAQRAMLAAAARSCNSAKFVAANAANLEDIDAMTANLVAGHKAGRAAIKAVQPDLPVGVSLSMFDDVAGAPGVDLAPIRQDLYGAWFEAVRGDDFLGVQNYERVLWGPKGKLPPPPGTELSDMGGEIYPPSLAHAVGQAHASTGVPIIVTEHGVGTSDDRIRQRLIPAALRDLKGVMDQGVPVKGYVHWSLLDNFEWIFGYGPKYGLYAVDRATFRRTPKPSVEVYGAIARSNRV